MSVNTKKISNIREEISDFFISSFDSKNKESNIVHKMLDDILNAMNESTNITITDYDGTILYVNSNFCRLSKFEKEEIIGQNHRIVNSGFHSEEFFIQLWETIRSGYTWRGEIQHRAKDGTVFWVFEIIVPILDEEGQPYYFVSFQTDVTENKQMESQFKLNFIRTFQNLQNGIFKVRKEQDGTLKYILSEGKLMAEIGAGAELILSKSPFDVFDQDIAKIKEKMYTKALKGKKVQYEIELGGKLIFVDIEPIRHNGEVTEIVGTVHDFSQFREVQKQLKVNEERYQSLINYSHEYITMLDKEGTIVHMNAKTLELLGIEETVFGKMSIIDVTVEEERPVIAAYLAKALQGEVQFFEFEVKNNGQRRFLNVTLVPMVMDNEIDVIYSIGKDITEEKLVQERNAFLAHHDELTGLPNRRWMEKKIQDSLKQAEENKKKMAILSLDLDRFKSINDTLGHAVGDELLQQIAVRLNTNPYKDKYHVARMGGDELMLLCPNFETRDEVIEIAQNILESLKYPFYVQGSELLLTASIGIDFYPSNDANVTELMKRVDVALYKAKEFGRNMYQIYDSSMNQANYQSFVMERDLRKAIMNEEFVAYLQPRVDALTGKIVSAEALVRWNHPEHGLISPGLFIPIAEETGLIIAIGKWMKKRVSEQLVAWRNAGLPLVPISVNISSKRFLQQGFAEEISELLEQYELEGKWLEIEITENSIMLNEENVQKTLLDLKEMGVKIYIDDFGTGYSSFNYLKIFKIDGVKIDQSFIRDISHNPENATITSAMIKMAQLLKLEVIAEGVETKEELDFLLGENCRYIQGFYFGKPCPIEEFENSFIK
ncbi:EAL domain-containing protein [Solibacillus isronensis]|uniref:EAL domain-containing protein n=1 Tax=Solibacillus isronensis TaxID=412383 RepID=UPI00203EA105|nr:EAL domain-containing protein [Solibacillus isronensis]MCM3721137.1 EAL domain-containing protein [Solibacillus isronensis]